ncbi:MAG: manganese efflux pump MntP [Christensenellales bacterium]
MGLIELLFIAMGLSMDAFAVALCKGLSMKTAQYKNAGLIALFFGGFQALMPLLGYFLGTRFAKYVTSVGPIIAFGLLLLIGVKMIIESRKGEEGCNCSLKISELLYLAAATSIDALAVGVSFAFLKVDIAFSVLLIGSVTFALSFLGALLGCRLGMRFAAKAELAGGLVLIFIGAKILLEHMGAL